MESAGGSSRLFIHPAEELAAYSRRHPHREDVGATGRGMIVCIHCLGSLAT